jgi:hypothetical protein
LVVWWPDQIRGLNAKYISDACLAAQKASRHPAIPSFDHENRQLDLWNMAPPSPRCSRSVACSGNNFEADEQEERKNEQNHNPYEQYEQHEEHGKCKHVKQHGRQEQYENRR